MARKYSNNLKRSESLVSDYIGNSLDLTRMIGSVVLLHLMADENIDDKTYRRLTTSARAIRNRDKHPRRELDADSSEDRYLFDKEEFDLLTGDYHECQR